MRFSVQGSAQDYRWVELYSRLVRVAYMSNIKTIYLFTGKAQSGKNYIARELNKALTVFCIQTEILYQHFIQYADRGS